MLSKRLVRSESDRRLAGVCGGLAAYLDIDPTLVRVAFIILTLASGVGLMLYVIMAVITPTQSVMLEDQIRIGGDDVESLKGERDTVQNSRTFVALLLAAGGVLLLLANFGVNIGFVWPLALIGIGVWLINSRSRSS